MVDNIQRLLMLDAEFKEFVKSPLEFDSYYNPETGAPVVCITKYNKKLNQKFQARYEIGDSGYSAQGIVRQLNASIRKQEEDAKARKQ